MPGYRAGKLASNPERDRTRVISFTINPGLNLYLQLIPASEILLTRCDSQHRAGEGSQEGSFQSIYVFEWLSHA